MAMYHVEAEHTKEECLADLDQMAMKPEVLERFEWGCMSGEHKGWAMIEADSEEAVRSMLPMAMRDRAHITPVSMISPEQIRQFHQTM